MDDLSQAARTVVERCVAVADGESVLVVCDPDRRQVGEALHDASLAAGGDSVLCVLPPRAERGTEPPPTVAAAFQGCDVFLAPCLPSLSHTRARKAATSAGARGATLPGVTAELLARLMGGDLEAVAQRSRRVAELLDGADEARLTCPRGSDLTFDLGGRRGIPDDGDLAARGAFGNLPCGEGFIAPAGGSGVAMVTSVGTVGLAPEPARLTVEDGRLVDADGDAGRRLLEHLLAHGEDGRHLAELGVGTNDRATLTGNILEDEKLLGTVHVAFGASAAIGGTVSVPVHQDSVVVDATLTVGDTTVLEDGRFLLG